MGKNDKTKHTEDEMSFLDHLEELRWHIVRSVIAALVFMVIAFINRQFIFDTIILKVKTPEFPTNRFFSNASQGIANWFESMRALSEPMSFFQTIGHWISNNINIGEQVLVINSQPLNIVNIEMAGQFISHIKVSLVAGLIAASPYIIWEIWRFIKPALYANEKNHTRGAVFYISVLFLIGILFGYYLITPLSIHFLSNYNVSNEIANTIKLNSYIGTVTSVTFASGIIFELPILVLFLSKVGIVTPQLMRKYRRHSYVGLLVLSAIITPPDVFSQLLVCGPLILLYEISVFISRSVARRSKSNDEDEEGTSIDQDDADDARSSFEGTDNKPVADEFISEQNCEEPRKNDEGLGGYTYDDKE